MKLFLEFIIITGSLLTAIGLVVRIIEQDTQIKNLQEDLGAAKRKLFALEERTNKTK